MLKIQLENYQQKQTVYKQQKQQRLQTYGESNKSTSLNIDEDMADLKNVFVPVVVSIANKYP